MDQLRKGNRIVMAGRWMTGIQDQQDQMNKGREEGVSEGIWKVIAKTKDHLKVCVESKYSRSSLKYICKWKIYIESTDNGQDKGPTRHLTSPSETSSSGNVLHLIELVAWTPQVT